MASSNFCTRRYAIQHHKKIILSIIDKIQPSIRRTIIKGTLVWGGGGGTLIFSYIHRLGPFWGVQNCESHYLGGFQKNEYFLGYEDFVDIFLGSPQNWTIFRTPFYVF